MKRSSEFPTTKEWKWWAGTTWHLHFKSNSRSSKQGWWPLLNQTHQRYVMENSQDHICINVKMSLQLVNRSTMVRSCSDDCWDEFIGFWIEGCLVPVIAAFGIVGGWWSLLLSSIKTQKPTHKCASCTCITCITTRCQILCSMRLQCVSKILTPHPDPEPNVNVHVWAQVAS